MKITDFDYILPNEYISIAPLDNRESSRLLNVKINGDIEDKYFNDIVSIINEGDVIVLNNSKVIYALIDCKVYHTEMINYNEKLIQLSILTIFNEEKTQDLLTKYIITDLKFILCKVLLSKKVKAGNTLILNGGLEAIILYEEENGVYICKINIDSVHLFYEYLKRNGKIPIPPYIQKKRAREKLDKISDNDHGRYQTIYGNILGSVAAHTAGLHFTSDILKKIKEKGAHVEYVTLHIGGGTFLSVYKDNINEHVMHAEFGSISKDVAYRINQAKKKSKRIIAVGTSVTRVLETFAKYDNAINKYILNEEFAEISTFIKPGYIFKIVDTLITNFHAPKSTPLILVSAFLGLEKMLECYKHAIKNNYRFLSYGDSCVFEKAIEI